VRDLDFFHLRPVDRMWAEITGNRRHRTRGTSKTS
jgi:hypothetical protein